MHFFNRLSFMGWAALFLVCLFPSFAAAYGDPVSSFGTSGIQTWDPGGTTVYDTVVDNEGRTVVVGSYNGGYTDQFIARFGKNGALDTSFSDDLDSPGYRVFAGPVTNSAQFTQ